LDEPAPVVRYQCQRPGELLHLDIKKLARFDRVGHHITGNRLGASQDVGYDFLAIDDATRLAHVEVLPDDHQRVRRVLFDCVGHFVSRRFHVLSNFRHKKHYRSL
jgi:hypothetical protein